MGDTISTVPFDCVYLPILHFFNDTYVIRSAVLAFAGTVPVEEDDVAGGGDVGDGLALGVYVGGLLPAVAVFEPLDADAAACGLGQGPVLNVAALVGAPGDEAGAPLNAAGIAHVAPVGLAGVSHLGQRHGHKIGAAGTGAVEDIVPEGHVLV